MAIRAEEISTDITLELDEEEISVADFTAACKAFFALVREISRHVKQEDVGAAAWSVKVYEGSAGIGVTALPSVLGSDAVAKVREKLIDGLDLLSKGIRPDAFSDRAIEFANNLANTFKRKPKDPNIRVWSRAGQFVPVGRSIAKAAKEILEPIYEDEGTVEGRLEKLDGHDKTQFVVYDILDDRAIKCEVNDQLLKQALKYWQQRIEVVGKVRYRKDGHPVSIKATELIPFPSADEIPSLEEMRLLLSIQGR
jgi:hypothetical protein